MRTYEDQLAMRSLYMENDLICCEIQNINGDGGINLHSRSLKYGKLENGQLLTIPCHLIKSLPQHYISLPPSIGLDIILGRNGMIWITRTIPGLRMNLRCFYYLYIISTASWYPSESEEASANPQAETLQLLKQKHAETPMPKELREKISRMHNSILVLLYQQQLDHLTIIVL